ncbi:MAG: NEW3 domain-containing protein [Thermoanaerobaculia bacterium]|nr:NEW3 domain-containing protein [Thermoanaerobaculia bacterium]
MASGCMPRLDRSPALRWLLIVVISCAGWADSASGQASGTYFNQRDDQYTLLGLKRAQEAFQLAQADFARSRELFEANLLPVAEFDRAKRGLSEAEVNYQQSILATLFENQYVAVTSAVKLRARDGGAKRVRLTLENTSGGGAEIGHLLDVDPELYERLRPEVVHDVYVALANDEGAVVSRPYEAKLEELRFGSPKSLEFDLLQDLDAVTVLITYGRGSQRSLKIFLEKDSSVDRVLVDSRQFSQEAELGASAGFDLDLELFSGSSDTYKLAVVGLPDEIDRFFQDTASGARLSQLKFTEGSETRRASLQVFLPDRPSDRLPIGSPIPFWVLVIPRDRLSELGDLEAIDPSPEKIAALDVGAVRLELVPRGVGRLRSRAPQLFLQTMAGTAVEATVELVNEGTRRLDNVEVRVDVPFGWQEEIVPELIPRLGVGEEAEVTVRLTPPADVPVGRYEARVRSTSFADEKAIEGEDKNLTVEIRQPARLGASMVLAGVMVLLVLAVVVAGVRLARR